MLAEELAAIAAAGAGALVQAAGTDAWTGIRDRVSHLFGREQEQRTSESLDLTLTALEHANPSSELAQVRARQAVYWQVRFEDLLNSLAAEQQQLAVVQLREVIEGMRQSGSPSDHLSISGDVSVRATHGSVAGVLLTGDIHIENPLQPGSERG
ncbi:hypothetical protein [Streptomyces sp. NPDC048361]|uniref:hypothetical protein n=1 Tax=Streptomyces sp. NPDC048361 TaxID=3154720 RepID=UPI0034287C53